MTSRKIGQEDIMQMATGFWVSKALFAGIELGVFEVLSTGRPLKAVQISERLGLPKESLERLLSALCALGLLEKRAQGYAAGTAARSFLVKSSPTFLGGNFGHLSNDLYPLWRYLSDAVRENNPRWKQAFGPDISQNPFEAMYGDPVRLSAFMSAMSAMTVKATFELLEHFDFSDYRYLLDVGGAVGAMAVTVLSRYKDLKAIVFDLPQIFPLAERFIAESGLNKRIRFVKGDMFSNPLPTGADIISLGWILHDWDDASSLKLLKSCFNALPSGGSILVLEKFLNDDKTGPLWATLMSLNMLVASLGGRERTAKEYRELMAEAGFVESNATVLSGMRDFIVARKP